MPPEMKKKSNLKKSKRSFSTMTQCTLPHENITKLNNTLKETCLSLGEQIFIILVELMYIVFVPFDWTRALSRVCF